MRIISFFRVDKKLMLSIMRNQLSFEFIQLLFLNFGLRRHAYPVSLFVTSKCSVGCKECIMRHLRKAYEGYQMSIEELTQFIDISEGSRYAFDIILTGGEPLEWVNFKEGVSLLHASKICNSLTVFSNVKQINQIDDEVMQNIDILRISKYPFNAENIRILKEKYPDKVFFVEREQFWANPRNALLDTLPAKCLNEEIMLFNYRVYACPHSASIALFNKSKVCLSNPLEAGFIKGLRRIKKNQQKEICTFCISNLNVRKKVELKDNIPEKNSVSL
jgi:organic radical activating enzyme